MNMLSDLSCGITSARLFIFQCLPYDESKSPLGESLVNNIAKHQEIQRALQRDREKEVDGRNI